ncbi:MAG: serine/threonine protein kinase [Planctomycetota bacterium]|nr:MAG: serine/threonine protein kinase [Planctomycetota bacterium]
MTEEKSIPEKIGPYRIERELGAGGMGTVYYGRHETTGLEAAIKVLPASLAREEGFVYRFKREIDALRKVKSPHIVEFYESGVDDDISYYAMEYVDGETLTARLTRERRIPWRDAIDIALQVCRALKSAHNAGIVHRDLKPSNLMLGADGAVKLTDFGVAQVFAAGQLTMPGGVIGTAEYMSPEQARGKRATKRSDVYSLGAVLYVMLTGRPPFTGQSALEISQKHIHNRFDSPRQYVPELPHWLDEVVCKCLEKEPEDRYPDAHVLSLRLAEIPKKVDYLQEHESFEFGSGEGTAETMAESTSGASSMGGEVGGTLMRDLMQAHLDEQRAATPVGSLLDNTWVLVGLLLLLILGGVFWYRSRDESPEELFARGERLMQRSAGSAWEQARRECFLPLIEKDPETWKPRVDGYLDQIAAYAVEREVRGAQSTRTGDSAADEVDRFLQRAFEQQDEGDYAAAEATLTALNVLMESSPRSDQERRAVRHLLREVRAQAEDPPDRTEQYPFLRTSLERAEELQLAGEDEQALRIWESVLALYGDDPGADGLLHEARRRVAAAPAAPEAGASD